MKCFSMEVTLVVFLFEAAETNLNVHNGFLVAFIILFCPLLIQFLFLLINPLWRVVLFDGSAKIGEMNFVINFRCLLVVLAFGGKDLLFGVVFGVLHTPKESEYKS